MTTPSKSKSRATVATTPNPQPVVSEEPAKHNDDSAEPATVTGVLAPGVTVLAPALATARGPGLVERVAKELGVWRRRKP